MIKRFLKLEKNTILKTRKSHLRPSFFYCIVDSRKEGEYVKSNCDCWKISKRSRII